MGRHGNPNVGPIGRKLLEVKKGSQQPKIVTGGDEEEEEAGFEIKRFVKKNATHDPPPSSKVTNLNRLFYSKEYLADLQLAHKKPNFTEDERSDNEKQEARDSVDGDAFISSNIEDRDLTESSADEEEEDFIALAQDELQLIEGAEEGEDDEEAEEEFTNELDVDEGRGFEDGMLPLRDEDVRDYDKRRREEIRQAIEEKSDSESDDWTLSQTRIAGAPISRSTRPRTPEIAPLPDLASVLYHLKEVYERKNEEKSQLLDELEILRNNMESLDTRMEQVQTGLNKASVKYGHAESKLATRETSVS